MKKRKNKVMAMAVTALLSSVLLVSTALAASYNVSGYETAKQAFLHALDAMNASNYTVIADAGIYYDGEMVGSEKAINYTESDHVSYSKNESQNSTGDFENFYDEKASYYVDQDRKTYHQYDKHYNYFHTTDETVLTNVENGGLSDNEKKLIGMALDLFAGDIKNYFTTDGDKVSISLSKSQIPEIVQTGLAVASEGMRTEMEYYDDSGVTVETDFDSIFKSMLNDISMDYATGDLIFDENNNIDTDIRIDFSGTDSNGEKHTASIVVSLEIKDIGTTVAPRFNPEGYERADYQSYGDVKAEEASVYLDSIGEVRIITNQNGYFTEGMDPEIPMPTGDFNIIIEGNTDEVKETEAIDE